MFRDHRRGEVPAQCGQPGGGSRADGSGQVEALPRSWEGDRLRARADLRGKAAKDTGVGSRALHSFTS